VKSLVRALRRGRNQTPVPARLARRERSRGQGVVEFALVLPLLLFLLLGIADFARIYATQIAVEAAAREAADFGAFYPWKWEGDPADPGSNAGKTVQGMLDRACLATKNLPEYVGPDDNCSNPSFSYVLDTPPGVKSDECSAVPRGHIPCKVTVTLGYRFDLIVPVSIPFGDRTLGLPSTLHFERTSTFAISDFEIDKQTPAP
jgi:hypothetical protein